MKISSARSISIHELLERINQKPFRPVALETVGAAVIPIREEGYNLLLPQCKQRTAINNGGLAPQAHRRIHFGDHSNGEGRNRHSIKPKSIEVPNAIYTIAAHISDKSPHTDTRMPLSNYRQKLRLLRPAAKPELRLDGIAG
jgi:hypothetical protein